MTNKELYLDPDKSMSDFNLYCLAHRNEFGNCKSTCGCTKKVPHYCYYEWLNLETDGVVFTDAYSEEETLNLIKNNINEIKLSEEELEHLTSDDSHTIKLNEPEMVNHPEHYNSNGMECIDVIKACMSEEAYKGFLRGNAIKYLWRYEKKVAPKEDLDKAIWYINKLKEEI